MRIRRIRTWLVGLGLVAAMAGAGTASAQQAATITAAEFSFTPASLTATAGQPVRWTVSNAGRFPHDMRVQVGSQTVDAMPGDATIAAGQSATFSFTFSQPGTYQFWCPVGTHRDQGMAGTITVVAAGAQAASAQAPATLPRTGDLSSPLAPLALLLGALLLGIGWRLRGRAPAAR